MNNERRAAGLWFFTQNQPVTRIGCAAPSASADANALHLSNNNLIETVTTQLPSFMKFHRSVWPSGATCWLPAAVLAADDEPSLSIAYPCFFSQRTQVYATVALQRNNDRAVFGLGPASTPPDDARGANLSALALGIQHKS